MAIHIDTSCTCGLNVIDDTCDICGERHCPCMCDDCSEDCSVACVPAGEES